MEASKKNLVGLHDRFGGCRAQTSEEERCLCCEATFGCKMKLFGHLKSKHWTSVFDVLMMGPGSDPVERWIDGILNNKCKYDGSDVKSKEEALQISSECVRVEVSDTTKQPVSLDLTSSPKQSLKRVSSNRRLENSDATDTFVNGCQQNDSLSFHSFVSEDDSNAGNAGKKDRKSASRMRKEAVKKDLASLASMGDANKVSGRKKKMEAVVKGVEKSTSSSETNTHFCRRCGKIIEERLPHVLEVHLKAEIFQCRQCNFFSHSCPKDVFDHISLEHPNDVASLNFFCNRLDDHRVEIDRILLDCFGIRDPAELAAVMCASSIRGYLDGLEFFRRALQVDNLATTAALKSESTSSTQSTSSDANRTNKPDSGRIQLTKDDAESSTDAATESPVELSLMIKDDAMKKKTPIEVHLDEEDEESDAEILSSRVAETSRSAASTSTSRSDESQPRPRRAPVDELREDFRNIDNVIVVEEPKEKSVTPVQQRVADQLDCSTSFDSPPTSSNQKAGPIEHDRVTSDESFVSLTISSPESSSTLALNDHKHEIACTLPIRRGGRTVSSTKEQGESDGAPIEEEEEGKVDEEKVGVEKRSLRQTPGRQALAAELRMQRAAELLSSTTTTEEPSKRQAPKRSRTDSGDEVKGKSRRMRTPPSTASSEEKSHPPSGQSSSMVTKNAPVKATARSVAERRRPTPETSPSVSRKSMRTAPTDLSDPSNTPARQKSTVVESKPRSAGSTTKQQARKSDTTMEKQQSPSSTSPTTSTPGSDKEVTCKECHAVVKFRERKRHVLRQHVRLPLYECPVAGCNFSSYTNLSHCREHILNVHKRNNVEAIDNRSKFHRQIDEWMRKCL